MHLPRKEALLCLCGANIFENMELITLVKGDVILSIENAMAIGIGLYKTLIDYLS